MSSPGEVLGLSAGGAEGPPERSGLLLRERVLGLLFAPAEQTDVVLLVAPAGYGKTTVLGQWAVRDGRPYAWVRVEDDDNDPVRLLRHVAVALHRVMPLGDDVLAALAARDASLRAVLVPRLVDWMARQPEGGVLVLDDLHVLHDPASLAVVAALAGGLPSGWRLAVSSRRRPGVNLVPFRGRRRYVELGLDDLAFDAREAAALLEASGSRLPDEVVEALVRRVEGWPAALYLAALSVRASADPAATAARIVEDDAPLSAYVRTTVLDPLPDETVEFLLHTSVLDRLTGPLCDAVAGTTGSGTLLAELERRNLLVVPEDRRGEWYRYHRLLADVLRTELRKRDPTAEESLHRRAAAWFDDQARPEEAIAHALAGGDVVTAARLVTSCTQPLVNTGRIRTVRRWVEAIGDEGVAAYPPYAVMAGWAWAMEGEGAEAQHFLAMAERATFEGRPADGSASLESGVALLRGALAPAGVEEVLRDARRAVELEPPGSPWYPLACTLLGASHALHGSDDAAMRAFERTIYFGNERQSSAVITAHAELAILATRRGDWPAATSAAVDATEAMRRFRLQEYPHSAVAYAVAARVAAHDGNRSEALFNISSAMRLAVDHSRRMAFPWLRAQIDVVVGETLLDLGDLAAAQRMTRAARRRLLRLPTGGVLPAQVQQLERAIARRSGRPGTPVVTILSEAEQRVVNLLPTHLNLTQIGQELGVSRNTVKTQVKAVYRKVGARTRTEAISRSRELGLLGA